MGVTLLPNFMNIEYGECHLVFDCSMVTHCHLSKLVAIILWSHSQIKPMCQKSFSFAANLSALLLE